MPSKNVRVSSSATRPGKKEVTVTLPSIKSPLSGFWAFFRNQGVVGLAIGIFLGSDAKTVIDSLTNNVVNPVVGIITGNINLSNESVCIKHVGNVCRSAIGYGSVISAVISFVIAVVVIYLIVKMLRLDKFDQKKT